MFPIPSNLKIKTKISKYICIPSMLTYHKEMIEIKYNSQCNLLIYWVSTLLQVLGIGNPLEDIMSEGKPIDLNVLT